MLQYSDLIFFEKSHFLSQAQGSDISPLSSLRIPSEHFSWHAEMPWRTQPVSPPGATVIHLKCCLWELSWWLHLRLQCQEWKTPSSTDLHESGYRVLPKTSPLLHPRCFSPISRCSSQGLKSKEWSRLVKEIWGPLSGHVKTSQHTKQYYLKG